MSHELGKLNVLKMWRLISLDFETCRQVLAHLLKRFSVVSLTRVDAEHL